MLLLACTQISCRYVYDTICIDIKCYLDLRNAASCRRDTVQSELAEGLIVSRELSLTMKNIDINGRLIIGSCGEYLALLGRDCCVSLDQTSSDTALSLDGK